MERHEVVKATSKGQLTLPVSVRKELGIRKGSRFLVLHRGAEIGLRPIAPITESLGADKKLESVNLDDLKKIRQQWDKEFKRHLGVHL